MSRLNFTFLEVNVSLTGGLIVTRHSFIVIHNVIRSQFSTCHIGVRILCGYFWTEFIPTHLTFFWHVSEKKKEDWAGGHFHTIVHQPDMVCSTFRHKSMSITPSIISQNGGHIWIKSIPHIYCDHTKSSYRKMMLKAEIFCEFRPSFICSHFPSPYTQKKGVFLVTGEGWVIKLTKHQLNIDNRTYHSSMSDANPAPHVADKRIHCVFCGVVRTYDMIKYNNCSCGYATGPFDHGIGYNASGHQMNPIFRSDGQRIGWSVLGEAVYVLQPLVSFNLRISCFYSIHSPLTNI